MKNLIYNNLLFIAGLILLFISSMVIWGNLVDYDIYKNGFEITVNVIDAPENCDNVSSRGGFCKLEYNGKVYVVRAGNKYCSLVSGQSKVKMLTDKSATKLQFPEEFNSFEYYSGFILLAFSIYVIVKGYMIRIK
ncbi:hypothetical protein [Flavobacterium stagni]|uniref:DUF3592 domain-containing protein n=1 Tax=Flavobacterium stagni TaxID=2506421 RepID=A0A4Q1K2F4_9FLAO|nr:hypothetical protein [Flavobacterium stagni]RXR18889.1 hypothetical protein EQG61_13605 [Flavobacterium stagni]